MIVTDITNVKNVSNELIVKKLSNRDLSIDFVRVTAILLVVILHTLMVGLTSAPNGLIQENPLEELTWFPVASWFGQIMPLFFVAGGFASWVGYHSLLNKGGTYKDYMRSRAIRLIYPVAIFYGIFFIVISLAVVTFGVSSDLMNMFLAGIGMPLWFVVAYLICQLLVPVLIHCHKRYPLLTVGVLFVGVIVVDYARYVSGVQWVGWINLLFVWPLIQQFGFFIADNNHSTKTIWLWAIVVGGFAATGAVTLLGYNPNMLSNLNPPNLPLVLIGVSQTAVFLLLRKQIQKLIQHKLVRNFVLLVGTRAMTIYLWHLPIIVGLSSLVMVLPDVIPSPQDGGIWWVYRFGLLVPVAMIVFVVTLGLARFEAGPLLKDTPNIVFLVAGVLLALIPTFFATEYGLGYSQIVWGSVLLVLSVWVLRGTHRASKAEVPG